LDLNDASTLRRLLLDHTGHTLALEQRLDHVEPKAAALDVLTNAEGNLCITDAAKVLKASPKDLFNRLHRQGWIYRRPGGSHWIGYQTKIAAGLITHRVTRLDRGPTEPAKFVEQVLITPKGMAKLAEPSSHGA
jgi:phage antirepressor YoqD-like protein